MTATSKAKTDAQPDAVAPDHGCRYFPRCVECPFRNCIAELSQRERLEFAAAWRTVLKYVEPASLPPE